MFPSGIKLDIPDDITSPTPAAVNTVPKAAKSWGNILVDPTDWTILLLSSTKCFGLAFNTKKVVITAATEAIPMATVPDKLVNCAITKDPTAITIEGKKILFFNFLACISAKSTLGIFRFPIFTCLLAVNTPITKSKAPTTTGGIAPPAINIIDNIVQKIAVPILVLCSWSFNVSIAVFNIKSPTII